MRKRKMIVAIVMKTTESLLSSFSTCLSIVGLLCDYLEGDLVGLCHCQVQRSPDDRGIGLHPKIHLIDDRRKLGEKSRKEE